MFVQKVLYEGIILTVIHRCMMCGWLHKAKLALAELIRVEAMVRRQYTLCFCRTVLVVLHDLRWGGDGYPWLIACGCLRRL